MTKGLLGKAMLLAWAQLGVVVEKHNEASGNPELYISVPEHSYRLDATNNEMAGMYLAKSVKRTFVEMGAKDVILKAKIRKGEYWTEEMEKAAYTEMENAI